MNENESQNAQTAGKTDTARLARAVADFLDQRLATDIRVVDLSGISPICDCVVVASATSAPHLRALAGETARHILETLPGKQYPRVSGDAESAWIILDYFDVIVHLFLPEARTYYDIEALWERKLNPPEAKKSAETKKSAEGQKKVKSGKSAAKDSPDKPKRVSRSRKAAAGKAPSATKAEKR